MSALTPRADIERISEWVGEFQVTRKESDRPTGVGTAVRSTLEPGDGSGTWEVVEWDPPRKSSARDRGNVGTI